MVYVTDDGDVVKSAPWGLRRIFGFFTGVIYMIIMFFQTLINPGMNRSGNQYSRDYRPGSGPRPPMRRLGRPNTGNNVDIPFFGGCSSCAR
ncbi:PREDICTED: selenoprotein K-like [Acromyrmex echinatior]|uniref:selenoprotein K-like n=1 Tax=Acromyrmex echinatior TaxID=103372 RepID=UPI000580BA16|nr:PREDICTED: selenoprotein K-like [Acromyrmex echinatior]